MKKRGIKNARGFRFNRRFRGRRMFDELNNGNSQKAEEMNIGNLIKEKRLKAPLQTRGTAAQYAAFSKDRRSAAKDVGGFVGGRLKNGRRSSKNVVSRSLITLDADYADEKLIDNLASLEFAAVVYSTHSSKKDAGKLPSFLAMSELAASDAKTKKLLYEERESQAKRDFAADENWQSGIKTTKSGAAENMHENIHYILSCDPKLKDAIRFNEFTGKVVKLKDLPWHKVADKSSGDIWSDADDVKLLRYLERYNKRFTRTTVLGQVLDVASAHLFHPVRDYLKSLKWDGVKRLERLFVDHLGASDTEYVRTVTRKALTAAVTRVFNPGAKFDYMTVLVGSQGVGKSSILRDIAKGWFTDNVFGVGSKEAMEQIQGFWIVEMAELAAMKKTEVESVKMFVGSQVDSYRAAYGRNREERPRQCVFFGTTNATAFLRDETGNRRFWPITVRGPYRKLTEEEIDQIWAEAVYYQSRNEPLYLDKRIEAEAARQQEAFEVEDPWAAIFIAYLEREIPEDWYSRTSAEHLLWLNSKDHSTEEPYIRREAVTAAELWEEALEGNKKDLKRNMGAIHAAMMKVPGWERLEGKVRVGGKVARAYGRIGSTAFAGKLMATKDGNNENDGNA